MPVLYEQQDKLKKQISFVSHEIRNNLSICDMYSQIIKRKLQNDGINNPSIENAVECIQKSLQLIGANLADLKSINNSEPVICSLKKTVSQCVELSKAYICDKKIEYFVELCDDANVYADENRLVSGILNILKNGIEAIIDKGFISVSLKTEQNNAILKIANNGEPIPDDIKNNIFGYGYTTKETGSGFGLCLTKQYFEDQHATLNLIKSDVKETLFEIVIPLAV